MKEQEKKITQDRKNAMDCMKEARKKIKEGRISGNMISVEAAERSLDLGLEKEEEGRQKLNQVLQEIQKIQNILFEQKQFKWQKIDDK